MKIDIKKAIQAVVQYITPNPYCEENGIKFWSKSAFDRHHKDLEIKRLTAEGKLHYIYYCGMSGTHAKVLYNLLKCHLAENNGYIAKEDYVNFNLGDGEVRLSYVCDEKFDFNKAILCYCS